LGGAGLVLECLSVWNDVIGTADVVGGIVQAGTAAREAVGVGVDLSVTADAGGGIVGSVVTACSAGNSGDVGVGLGDVHEDWAVVDVVTVGCFEVIGEEWAASLGGWVVALGGVTTTFLVVEGVAENGSATADLSAGVTLGAAALQAGSGRDSGLDGGYLNDGSCSVLVVFSDRNRATGLSSGVDS
jgi:hypothetical protein